MAEPKLSMAAPGGPFELALCICTADRPDCLARLLAVLASARLTGERFTSTVVIIVDNRPGGPSAALVAEVGARLPVPVRYVAEPRPGISFARNAAVAEALRCGAARLAFIDDDDFPHPDWLAELVRRQAETGAGIVLGAWTLPPDFKVPPRLEKIDFFKPFRPEDSALFGLPLWGGTFNMLIERDVATGLTGRDGPFLPEFSATGGEDTDLIIRAARAGHTIAVAERSVVVRGWEAERLTLRGAMRRGFRLGCSQMHLAARHLPAETCARLKRKSARRLLRSIARVLPALRRPKRLAVILVQIAYRAGEWHGARGRHFAYYR